MLPVTLFDFLNILQSNLKVDKDSLILIYSSGYLHAVSSTDGEVIWKKELANEGSDN